MTVMADHARISVIKPISAKAAAWAVLVVIGGTQITFNIVHAVHGGRLNLVLAILYGIAPVFTAMCLSHIVATYKGGWFMQTVTFAVMLGAMGLSISAAAAVVAPAAGPDARKWLFGLVLDTGVLLALRVILSERERDAARQETEQAEAMARDQANGAAALEQAQAEARGAAAVAAALEADLARSAAELARTTAALEAEQARQRSRQKAGQRAGQRDASDRDKTRDKVARLLADNAGWTNAEVARTAGVSERTVSRVRNAPSDTERRLHSVREG